MIAETSQGYLGLQRILEMTSRPQELYNHEIKQLIRSLAGHLSHLLGQQKQISTKQNINAGGLAQTAYVEQQIQQVKSIIDSRMSLFQELDQKLEKLNRATHQKIQQWRQMSQETVAELNHNKTDVAETRKLDNLLHQNHKKLEKILEEAELKQTDEKFKLNMKMENFIQEVQRKISSIKQVGNREQKIQYGGIITTVKNISSYLWPWKGSKSEYNSLMDASLWVSKYSVYYKYLKFNENKVRASDERAGFLTSEWSIPNEYEITIAVDRIKRIFIVGLCDSACRGKTNTMDAANRVLYSNECQFTGGANNTNTLHNVGKGFREGEIVTMQVNLATGLICWKVGDDVRYETRHPALKNRNIKWICYLYAGGKGSAFRLLKA